MRKRLLIYLPLFVLMLWVGCTYKKEVVDYPPITTITCDTANVKYSVEIVTILSANCYRCHAAPANAGGGIVLNNYSNLKPWATSNTLYHVVNQTPGYDPMPKGASKIPACDIAKIRTWIRNGSLNN
jgi:hypothetical protein